MVLGTCANQMLQTLLVSLYEDREGTIIIMPRSGELRLHLLLREVCAGKHERWVEKTAGYIHRALLSWHDSHQPTAYTARAPTDGVRLAFVKE